MRLPHLFMAAERRISSFPAWLPLLALRLALAVPFWRSGMTKWDGFLSLSAGAKYLFAEEFRLHLLGASYPFPFPQLSAFLAASAEVVLPVLLVLGLGTRFSALALLVMVGVIQLTVPEGWANFHLPWAAMALTLIAFGGGAFSLDSWLARGSRSALRKADVTGSLRN